MAATQPVSRAVAVAVQITPAAAQSQSLSNLLFLGASDVIDTVERFRTYADLKSVAADFGSSAEEYKAAARWFGQSPQPKALLVGRFAFTATKGGLRCGTLSAAQQAIATWSAVNNGSLKIAVDGAAGVDVTGINLSAATNLNAVAAAIQGGTGMPAGVTVVWDATYGRFEFKSSTTGATSAIGFLTAAATGTDLSAMLAGTAASSGAYVYGGMAAETAAAALAAFDNLAAQRFYGVALGGLVPGANAGADTQQIMDAAAYVEAAGAKHMLFVTTQEAGVLSSVTTTDVAYQLKEAGYDRTFVQYSSSAAHAALSAAARILTVDYEGSATAITLKFKQEPGVVAEDLTVTQALALEAKNCNVFVSYENGTSILEQGVQSSGEFTDIITGADWLATTIQRDVWNLLYSSNTKVPQTDEGATAVQAIVEARCGQAVRNGYAAPGTWNAGGFGILEQGDYMSKGFYVYISPMRTQAQADRAARKCPPIQVAIKLAGAIHSADVTINVNQ